MTNETIEDLKLRDPLSDVTRKERRFLLGISGLAITFVKAGVVPTKLTALGVEFGKTDQQSLLWILGFIILYFLMAFIIYAASDFIAWRLAFNRIFVENVERFFELSRMPSSIKPELEKQQNRKFATSHGDRVVFILSGPVSFFRAMFEFLLPVVVGVYAIVLVWATNLPAKGS